MTVQAARAVQVSVLVNIQLSEELDLEQAKEDIEAALREFFKGLGVGDGYLLTDISGWCSPLSRWKSWNSPAPCVTCPV